MQLLADARASALDQRQRDRAADIRAVIARGDVPQHLHRRPGLQLAYDLRALRYRLRRVLREKAHQMLAVIAARVGAGERALAEEVRLLLADDPIHAEIARR